MLVEVKNLHYDKNMTELEEIKLGLSQNPCPYCDCMGGAALSGEPSSHSGLWMWTCMNCSGKGNVGYDIHALDWIDLPPEKEAEMKEGKVTGSYSDFIRKWGTVRSKVGNPIYFNQDPSLY